MPTDLETTLPEVADDAPADRIAAAVAELQEMNSDGWAVFAANGVTVTTPVQLEFTFAAPAEDVATDLAEYLTAIVEHPAAAVAPATDFDLWGVRGVTPEAVVTETGLAEWVRRLVAVGYSFGDAELDGWSLLLD